MDDLRDEVRLLAKDCADEAAREVGRDELEVHDPRPGDRGELGGLLDGKALDRDERSDLGSYFRRVYRDRLGERWVEDDRDGEPGPARLEERFAL